jgi:hypothetical protein
MRHSELHNVMFAMKPKQIRIRGESEVSGPFGSYEPEPVR